MLLKQSSGNKLKKKLIHFFNMKLFANNCHVKVNDFCEWNPGNLITEMVSNGLPQFLNKKLQHKICQFRFVSL